MDTTDERLMDTTDGDDWLLSTMQSTDTSLVVKLFKKVNSRKSATAGTLHLRRPLMTNRGGLLLLQPREG